MAEETVTLTVSALRELVRRSDSTGLLINEPYSSARSFQRIVRIQSHGVGPISLYIERLEDGRIVQSTTVTVDQIFQMVDRVNRLLDLLESKAGA